MSLTSEEVVHASRSKRHQIIAGAVHVFDAFGYEGASMSRIAEQAGVSKGTLYNYFTSKSDLFGAFVEHETSEKIAWILNVAEPPGDVGRDLRRIAKRLTYTLLSNSAQMMHRIIVSEAGKFPHLARTYFEAVQQHGLLEMAGWLRSEAESGRLRIDDVTLAAEQFVALCRTRLWMLRCLNMKPTVSEAEIDAIVEATARMFLNTYGRDPDKQPEADTP